MFSAATLTILSSNLEDTEYFRGSDANLVSSLDSAEEGTDAAARVNVQLLAKFQDVIHAGGLMRNMSGKVALILHLQIETPVVGEVVYDIWSI